MTSRRFTMRLARAALLLALLPATARADDWPTRQIRIVDAFAAGATTDILARIIASRMSTTFGQPVIVDNRPGANGVIGSELAAKSAPDGYTFFVGSTSTLAVNGFLYKLSFDPVRDLAPVSMLASQSLILVVHPSTPFRSVEDLVAHARRHPGDLKYATPGIGNPVHLATALFERIAQAPMTHVPYARGSAAAMPDLLSGQVQLMFAPAYVMPMIKDGRLRALAVTGARRTPQLPEVPTVAEAGIPGFEVTLWNAAAVPAGTPRPVVDRLNAEIVRIFRSDDVRAQLEKTGYEAIPGTPEEQATFVRSEAERWGKLVRELAIRIE